MARICPPFYLALPILVMVGCGRQKSDNPKDVRILPGAPLNESAEFGYLPLKIAKSYERQKMLEHAPWHTDGGDWTFLDCELAKDTAIKVVIGAKSSGEVKDSTPFSWGEAMIAVNDTSSGARFVEAFARAFQQPVPSSHGKKPPGWIKVNTAVLGSKLNRDRQGGFNERGGTWTATKWFLGDESGEAEVFFNFSTAGGRAEFSEKDVDYREVLIEQWVIALRDGPLPERTPENDPNLTLVGPSVTNWVRVATSNTTCQFTPDSRRVIVAESLTNGGTRFSTFPVTAPAEQKLLAEFEGVARIHDFITNREPLTLFIVETLRQNRKIISSADPQRLWLMADGKKQAVPIPATLTNWYLGRPCLSPDGRFVALHSWNTAAKGKRTRIVHLGDLTTSDWQVIEIPETVIELTGWKNAMAILLTGTGYEKNEIRKAFQYDPGNRKLTPLDRVPDEATDGDAPSPGGAYTMRVEEKRRLVLTESGSGSSREFLFHPQDRRNLFEASVTWASPKYLVFHGPRTALIDAQSLKMNFVTPKEAGFSDVDFSLDFKVALGRKSDAYYLGRVELP